jgi:hypothetical protein
LIDDGLAAALIPKPRYFVVFELPDGRRGEFYLENHGEGLQVMGPSPREEWAVAPERTGRYHVGLDSALYMLWEHFGRKRFSYSLTVDPSWVLAFEGDRVAGIFLGKLHSSAAGDEDLQRYLAPGQVLVGDKLRGALIYGVMGAGSDEFGVQRPPPRP